MIGEPAHGPSPSAGAGAAESKHSPMRLGTNRKIFSSGILAAPLVALVQLWRCKDSSQSHQCGLTFQPGTSAVPPEPWAQFPHAIPAVRARKVPGRGTPLGAVPAHLVFRWVGAAVSSSWPRCWLRN